MSYAVAYSFGASPDGSQPFGDLVDVKGTLYGTTDLGGVNSLGTVFSMTTGGTEKVLHSFGKGTDGASPYAGMIDADGTLYGTTTANGKYIFGTVFSITPSGAEKVIHGFGKDDDGRLPQAPVIDVKGTLYGTTREGGTFNCSGEGCGTVFSLTTNGEEKVLHSFGGLAGKVIDGDYPYAGLTDLGGTLYGTTASGGAHGYGTVFSITTTGKEKVVYSFGGKTSDALYPEAGLIAVNGTFYGTTTAGGKNDAGTVFSVSTDGKEKVLHSFGSGTDGRDPAAALLDVSGTLYGTTAEGGANGSGGVVFSITTAGKEKVLHSFGSGTDGFYPYAGLIDVNGKLYGTTVSGGANNLGTVFSLTP